MSDPKKAPAASAAPVETTTPKLVYAPGAPIQSLPVRVKNPAFKPGAHPKDGEAAPPETIVEPIDLVPGKPWPLPADHKLTLSMRAAGHIVEADEKDRK